MATRTGTQGDKAMAMTTAAWAASSKMQERREIQQRGGGLAVAEQFYGADMRTWPTSTQQEALPMDVEPSPEPSSKLRGKLALTGTRAFVLAGHAVFTLVSLKTGARFTYKVGTPETPRPGAGPVHFVSVLTGPDNTSDYQFVGTIFGERDYRHSRKARITEQAPSVQAFTWFWRQLVAGADLTGKVEIYHEGRCGRCGRALTVPESVESGYGPDCRDKMGV